MYQLKSGDTVLIKTKGFLPSAIRWFQGYSRNHSLKIVKNNGIFYVGEAIGEGAFNLPIKKYLNKKYLEFTVLEFPKKLTVKQEKDFFNYTMSLQNINYEKKNLLWHQAIKYLSKKIFGHDKWIGAKNEKEGMKGFICGELTEHYDNWLSKLIGLYPHLSWDWWKGSPERLYNNWAYKKHEDYDFKKWIEEQIINHK